jgi:hypothetical protein
LIALFKANQLSFNHLSLGSMEHETSIKLFAKYPLTHMNKLLYYSSSEYGRKGRSMKEEVRNLAFARAPASAILAQRRVSPLFPHFSLQPSAFS